MFRRARGRWADGYDLRPKTDVARSPPKQISYQHHYGKKGLQYCRMPLWLKCGGKSRGIKNPHKLMSEDLQKIGATRPQNEGLSRIPCRDVRTGGAGGDFSNYFIGRFAQ